MENNNIDIGKVVLETLKLIIVKPLTLPWQIYQNALVNLSNSDNESSEESVMSSDFPLYVWYVSIFNALIFIIYPLGILGAIIDVMDGGYDAFRDFIIQLIIVYFLPLFFGLVRELLTVTLKTVYYLKRIANK